MVFITLNNLSLTIMYKRGDDRVVVNNETVACFEVYAEYMIFTEATKIH